MGLALVVTLLSGCAVTAPYPPVTDDQRAGIRDELLASLWRPVAESYPEALKPIVPVTHTVPDHDWVYRMSSCLRSRGYESHVVDNGLGYTDNATQGQTQLVFTVDAYNCQATWVSLSQVEGFLDATQLDAFYNFQVTTLQSCLRLAGAQTAPPPVRRLASGVQGLAGWSPYQVLWQSGVPSAALTYLETRCPPIPGWLDLADAPSPLGE